MTVYRTSISGIKRSKYAKSGRELGQRSEVKVESGGDEVRRGGERPCGALQA